MATTQPIRNPEDLKRLANYFLEKGRTRDYVFVVMATYTALRVSDLLSLRWGDVYDSSQNTFRAHIRLVEGKTKKNREIALNCQVIEALNRLLPERRGDFIFTSKQGDKPITRSYAWHMVSCATKELGISGPIGCHGLRKTFGYRCWRDKDLSPILLMELYNHSSYAITRRYLGISQSEMDKVYTGIELF